MCSRLSATHFSSGGPASLRTSGLSIGDSHGLIYAIRLGEAPSLVEGSVLGPPEEANDIWLHFDLVDSRARSWLENRSGIDPELCKVLVDAHAQPQLHVTSSGIFAVLVDLFHDFRDDPDAFGSLRIYVEERRIVTGRFKALHTLDVVRRLVADQSVRADSPLTVFELLLERQSTTFVEVAKRLAERLDKLEDEIVSGRVREQAAALGLMRRLLVRLRRHLGANRNALRVLAGRAPDFCDEECRRRWAQLVERFGQVAQELDLVQERTRLLQEEIASKLNEATNRNLYVISVATTIMLPISMITGIWGMNVGGIPWVGDPQGFIRVCVMMVAVVSAVLLLLRRSRIL
jgi:zinc transporter